MSEELERIFVAAFDSQLGLETSFFPRPSFCVRFLGNNQTDHWEQIRSVEEELYVPQTFWYLSNICASLYLLNGRKTNSHTPTLLNNINIGKTPDWHLKLIHNCLICTALSLDNGLPSWFVLITVTNCIFPACVYTTCAKLCFPNCVVNWEHAVFI